MSVVDKICHYQRNLQKCSDNKDRILHCISKLYNLPVTVQHLQETGVGRTVNSFRKYDGTVGDAAKALVFKWKVMVADEETSEDEDEICVPDVHENHTESQESKVEDVKEYSSSSLEQSSESKHRHKYKEIKSESSTKQNATQLSKSKSEEKHEKKHSSKHYAQNERKSSEKSSKSSVKKEEGHSSTKHNSSRNDDMKKNSDKMTEVNENNSRKRKLDNSSSSMKESKKRKLSESKSDDEKSQLSVSEKNHSRSKSSGIQIEVKIKVKDDQALSSDKNKQDKLEKYSQERSKSSSSKPKSIESSSKEKDSGERQKHKKEEYVSHKKHDAKKDSSHHSNKETSKSKVSSSSDKDHLKSKNKDKKKEQKEEKKQEKKKETKVKLMQEINGDEGIDCNSGTSFAEALGMCTMPQPSKKRHVNSSSTSLNKSIKTECMSPPINSNKKTPAACTVQVETECSSNVSNPPSLLAPNVKLEPLSVDLASTLPEISPNYKPLPYINPVHRREEVKHFDDMIYVKNQRTKVYSGNKGGYTSVPSLYDICIRVLIENIDALEYTGGVPYDILKPVLERATADQLFMLEHYNSYLVEDTDTLWQYHCNREFRNKGRQEMESWREMYMRCLDEREAKLKTLTANIKQSIDKSVPVRSTKLAYVDNIVKPPRNIMKKQAKYGTANATPSTISSVKKKLAAGGAVNNATNIAVPPPPMVRFKASTSNSMKKTKAPLMAKALQLIKGRYKR
ncbi:transcription elongation factor B polypeptide 3 isoform X2 [Linepithema humile]|uniref:transcription elongation factor B polypeptide 3 isoform X2 n=1 Tax=Linepithema humile TaxID=83485 RepID=UPI00062319CD|nr:PREDICTED: transcription elongation factor B polypeptide 3 isoform X1 [Linepithema humile]XP_012230438.1 PREDICTED: transcription elongation factor B polypeptide 3 isoform X2 [Linepithema humile]